jgi:hypothetical protein
MNRNEINESVREGINCLFKTQKNDGSFTGTASTSKTFSDFKENKSIFFTGLILFSLSAFSDFKNANKLKNKSANFLLDQKSEFWSWNYWKRNSSESKNSPYPDDLDDTCCIISALIKYNPKIIPIKAVSSVVNLLTFCESKEGGPYYTWITAPEADKAWKDIDPAVNSNIAFFLSLQDVFLPSLIALVEKAAASEKYNSPYYYSPYSVIYFISRWYKGKKKDRIISYLLAKKLKNYSWGNVLETALAVCTLINFGFPKEKLEKSVEYLVKNQKNGKWKAYPFVVERISKGKKYYSGSSELTTAFCLEACGKFLTEDESKKDGKKIKIGKESKKINKKILDYSDQRFSNFSPEIKKSFLNVRQKILKGDKNVTIALMPYYLEKALGEKQAATDENLIKLGTASLYGWIAYTIYDDFFDCEGDPKILSLANICLRELVSIYYDIFSKDEKFLKFFQNIMDRIDAANAWETANCRLSVSNSVVMLPEKLSDFGDLKKLADRSIGHALGAAAVMYFKIGDIESPEIKNLVLFFENYIIARQLNDDAHDWENDLKRGQLTPVVASVLEKYLKRKENKIRKELDLKKDIKELQKIFWYEVIQEMCGKSLFHAKEARKNLKSIAVIGYKYFLEKMVASVEQSAQQAISEQKDTLEFLKEYEK